MRKIITINIKDETREVRTVSFDGNNYEMYSSYHVNDLARILFLSEVDDHDLILFYNESFIYDFSKISKYNSNDSFAYIWFDSVSIINSKEEESSMNMSNRITEGNILVTVSTFKKIISLVKFTSHPLWFKHFAHLLRENFPKFKIEKGSFSKINYHNYLMNNINKPFIERKKTLDFIENLSKTLEKKFIKIHDVIWLLKNAISDITENDLINIKNNLNKTIHPLIKKEIKETFSVREIYEIDEYSIQNNLKQVDFMEYKDKVRLIYKKVMGVLEKFDIFVTSIGLTSLAHAIGNDIIEYDDDIDLVIDYFDFHNQKKNIVEELNSIGVKTLFWDDDNSHNQIHTINKFFIFEELHVVDEEWSLNCISIPFIDFVFSFSVDNINGNIIKRISKTLTNLCKYNPNSKIASQFNVESKYDFGTPVVMKNLNFDENGRWKYEHEILLKKYSAEFDLLIELSKPMPKVGKAKIVAIDFSLEWWGQLEVDLDTKKDFIGAQNLKIISNLDDAFVSRYGHKPKVFNDYKANPSHMNRESLMYLSSNLHWLKTKKAKELLKNDN